MVSIYGAHQVYCSCMVYRNAVRTMLVTSFYGASLVPQVQKKEGCAFIIEGCAYIYVMADTIPLLRNLHKYYPFLNC